MTKAILLFFPFLTILSQIHAQNPCDPDITAPTVVAKANHAATIQSNDLVTVYAEDLIESLSDNCNSVLDLRVACRRAGTGIGFPVDALGNPNQSVTYTCSELGTFQIEVWAQDPALNASFGLTTVQVQDLQNNCGGGIGGAAVCLSTENGTPITSANVKLTSTPPAQPLNITAATGANGCAQMLTPNLPAGASFIFTPTKSDEPYNGVTTLDALLITLHMLNVKLLSSPYKIISADVNRSNTVTGFDIILIRKYILGYSDTLGGGNNWRFVRADYAFPNPLNPWQATFPENWTATSASQLIGPHPFIGTKIGDVNASAAGFGEMPQDRTPGWVAMENKWLKTGESAKIPVYFNALNTTYGGQFELLFDPASIDITQVIPGELALSEGLDYAINPATGSVRFSWVNAEGKSWKSDSPAFYLDITARKAAPMHQVWHLGTDLRAEVYGDQGGSRQAIQLAFNETGRVSSFAAQPNPTTGATIIPVEWATAETIQIELLDARGAIVYAAELSGSEGAQQIEIPASAFPENGVYCWRLRGANGLASGKIIQLGR